MRETDEEAALLGRIAVRYGFITMEQLAEATRERGRGGKKLGAIMLEQGMLDELSLGKVLTLQKRHRDALVKKRAGAKKREVSRKRIPTPKGWSFSGKGTGVSPASMPRRERRTDDVVRARMRKVNRPTHPDRPGGGAPVPDVRELELETEPSLEAESPMDVDLDLDPPEPVPQRTARSRAERAERPTQPEIPKSPPPDAPPRGATQPAMRRAVDHDRAAEAPPAARPLAAPNPAAPNPAAPNPAAPNPAAPNPAGPHPAAPQAAAVTTARPQPVVSQPPPPPTQLEPLPWTSPETSNPRVAFLMKLLHHGVKSLASDVHVHAGTVARMRQLGQLVPMTEQPLAAAATDEALTAILTPWQQRQLANNGEVDIAYDLKGVGRFRANIYRQHHGTNGVFHVVPTSVPTLASLGLPHDLAKLTNYTQGLVLLTGPAGSGKTSTLAALTNIINEERTDHILTIEDPIEYLFQSKRCIINQRQVGRHTETFATGLRGALREDPDIICIGELRDLETISLALSAAETGHLVLATLHTGSAIGTINRIVGAYPPGQQPQVRSMLSESLRAITSQRLLPGTDGRPAVALETLFITRAVGALIRDNRTFQIGSVMQTGRSQGMRQLDDSLLELIEARKITREVALEQCNDPSKLGGA